LRTDTAGACSISAAVPSGCAASPLVDAARSDTAPCIDFRKAGTSSALARVFGFDSQAIVSSVASSIASEEVFASSAMAFPYWFVADATTWAKFFPWARLSPRNRISCPRDLSPLFEAPVLSGARPVPVNP
jgi:hypothetical protein